VLSSAGERRRKKRKKDGNQLREGKGREEEDVDDAL